MQDPTNTPPLKFPDVYREEQAEIKLRRRRQFYADDKRANHDCVGLALSGGGIRSATFCLGFLQELNRLKLLRIFDYLSTVSGGGYVGGWWSAWLSRDEKVIRRKRDPLLDISNVHNPASLVARIADGDDNVSKTLREQIRLKDNFTYRLLTKFIEGERPDPELLNQLVDQLNAFIKTNNYDEADADAAVLASVPDPAAGAKIAAAQKTERETARIRQNDRRWDNRFLLEESFPYELRNNFPPDEMIEPIRRSREDRDKNSEGSLHAYKDPIHHLRLFANYLTPRKGMLSADTWRAVSVITRNLILTWLILLPVLITVMLLGQAYLRLARPLALLLDANDKHADLILMLAPLIVLMGFSVVIAIGWLICNRESASKLDWLVQIACLLALCLLLVSGLYSTDTLRTLISSLDRSVWISLGSWAVITLALFSLVWFGGPNNAKIGSDETQWKKDVRRSRFSRAQAKLLVTTAVVSAVLFVSWICTHNLPTSFSSLFSIQFGFVSLISIAGSVFTAMRAKPTAGGDRAASREPSFISRTIFAVTPPLVLVVLATAAGFVGNRLFGIFIPDPLTHRSEGLPSLVPVAALLFILLCGALAAYEMKGAKLFNILEPSLSAVIFILAVVVNASWFVQALVYSPLLSNLRNIPKGWQALLFTVSTTIAVIVTVTVLVRVIPGERWKRELLERLEVAERDVKGARGKRVLIALRRVQAYVNVTFGLIILIFLAIIGGSVGTVVFHATTIDGGKNGGVSSGLILSFVSIAGGAIMYRLCLVRQPSQRGRHFDLKWLRDRPFGKRPEAHWVLAALCLVVPVAFVCLSHYLTHPDHDGGQLLMILFPFALAALFGVLIFLRALVIEKFAAEETPADAQQDQRLRKLLALSVILISVFVDPVSHTFSPFSMAPIGKLGRANLILMSVMLVVNLPIFGAAVFRLRPQQSLKVDRTFRWNWVYGKVFLWALAFVAIILALGSGPLMLSWLSHISQVPLNGGLVPVLLPGAAGCFLFVLFEMFWREGDNRRSLWLIALTYTGLATVFFLGLAKLNPDHFKWVYPWQVFLGLLAAVIVWVVALGWMVDPNAVSMHQFYKGRLVRAYLGASNVRRRKAGKTEITETVAGDDLLLSSLHNCDRGGPYHLINTTLNLVGGRDLATAQRSASSFTLSQKYCGSSRTDYRPTHEYMGGQLSLGTAVAASGAAVSPNMGSKKPTAALAMLMTLLNVRLGYWAPTPNRETWNSSQPRLWPFYLMREFFSQTNDVSTYCYLTDGGHFDNTGLYALIERGCRYIVLVDCGADPKPACFQDLGEAIRRCRIDFGTEIDLSLDPLLDKTTDPNRGFVFGRIHFSPEHLVALGKHQPRAASIDRTDPSLGTIVYVKPAVVPTVTADVRQYALENNFFPQQTTANQWFDEAQFESYRRLGEFCANKVFDIEPIEALREKIRLSSGNIEMIFNELENALEE
jgi:hypothetical protein